MFCDTISALTIVFMCAYANIHIYLLIHICWFSFLRIRSALSLCFRSEYVLVCFSYRFDVESIDATQIRLHPCVCVYVYDVISVVCVSFERNHLCIRFVLPVLCCYYMFRLTWMGHFPVVELLSLYFFFYRLSDIILLQCLVLSQAIVIMFFFSFFVRNCLFFVPFLPQPGDLFGSKQSSWFWKFIVRDLKSIKIDNICTVCALHYAWAVYLNWHNNGVLHYKSCQIHAIF